MGWDRESGRDDAESLLAPYVQTDGSVAIPDDVTITSFFARNAVRWQHRAAYRFLDFSDGEGRAVELSWNGLVDSVRAVGARLQQVLTPGDRVAILAPQGLDYVVGFFAAIHAGAIAVPLFAPTLSGHAQRLQAVLADAGPTVILTTTGAAESVRSFVRAAPVTERPRLIAIDAVPDSLATSFIGHSQCADDTAYLQYTSGSTRDPAGVEITHRAACTNLVQMILAGGLDMGVRSVSWLPLYHDMGLMMIMFPALCGGHITLMDPMAFVRRPHRWIAALAEESTHGRTFAAAPNFAFELAAERGLPRGGEHLDLSNVVGLLNGSEPVTVAAIEKFTTALGEYGLPATAVKPSYGLAEATLSVASIAADTSASVRWFNRVALSAKRAVQAVPGDPDAVPHVSCGQPIPSEWVAIVDPDTGEELSDRCVGEIWVHGNNVGRGYWGREDETRRVFGNRLRSRLSEDSHADGVAADASWLATGDLGVYVDGELYITGRIKDLIIIDGVNHYPHDIETTVGKASRAIRSGYVAAFAVTSDALPQPAGRSGEQLVIVAERAVGAAGVDIDTVASAVRAAVSRHHHVHVAEVRLVPAGSLARTTSGKLARHACRAEYLRGQRDLASA
ncbi:Long-chain-fatty-acid--CoA ligase [Mycolicibacterium rhodesiae JS60]|nr:Long-chain-fatty-acid--CoA ligase [Mycolicibacterium rhodesiae JS60]